MKSEASPISSSDRIAVLGSGSWGTALAIQIVRAGRPAIMWGIETDKIEAMARSRCNSTYLPGIGFPDGLEVTTEFNEALSGVEDVLVVVPSHAFRETLERLAALSKPPPFLVWATKGFETETGNLPHQVAEEVLGPDVTTGVLSGPTFAAEVGLGLPTAITIASRDADFALRLAQSLSTDTFRAYPSSDMVGVEVGGATKNVLAIGAGISDGLGFGANTRVALITRGLMEMTRLGLALGAQKDTFMGLSGMGDLVLTCTDDQSRNRRFGLGLAKGADVEEARKAIGQTVEGYYAARAVRTVAERVGVEMPIVEEIYKVIYERMSPQQAVVNLMRRPVTPE
ncbi:MAG TPA: NAD(P)H-dependent glycerol-3-phosphate dehydrogenase [Gammaproteobacteria bacterium]